MRYVHHDSRRALDATAELMRWRYAGIGQIGAETALRAIGYGWAWRTMPGGSAASLRGTKAQIEEWEEMA